MKTRAEWSEVHHHETPIFIKMRHLNAPERDHIALEGSASAFNLLIILDCVNLISTLI